MAEAVFTRDSFADPSQVSDKVVREKSADSLSGAASTPREALLCILFTYQCMLPSRQIRYLGPSHPGGTCQTSRLARSLLPVQPRLCSNSSHESPRYLSTGVFHKIPTTSLHLCNRRISPLAMRAHPSTSPKPALPWHSSRSSSRSSSSSSIPCHGVVTGILPFRTLQAAPSTLSHHKRPL